MGEKFNSISSEPNNFESDINFVEDLIKKHENGEMIGYSIYDFKSEKAKKIVDAFLNSKKKSKVANIGLELKSLLTNLKSSEFNQEKTNEGGFLSKIKQKILKLVGKTDSKLVKTLNDDVDINKIDLDKAINECNRHIKSNRYKNAKKFLDLIVKKTKQDKVDVSDLNIGDISKSKEEFNKARRNLKDYMEKKDYKKASFFAEALVGVSKKDIPKDNNKKAERNSEEKDNKKKVKRWGGGDSGVDWWGNNKGGDNWRGKNDTKKVA